MSNTKCIVKVSHIPEKKVNSTKKETLGKVQQANAVEEQTQPNTNFNNPIAQFFEPRVWQKQVCNHRQYKYGRQGVSALVQVNTAVVLGYTQQIKSWYQVDHFSCVDDAGDLHKNVPWQPKTWPVASAANTAASFLS